MPLSRAVLGKSPAAVITSKVLDVKMNSAIMNFKRALVCVSFEHFLTNWADDAIAFIKAA